MDPTTQEYIKNPRLLELNPKGLVPTMEVFLEPKNNQQHEFVSEEKDFVVVSDSINCVDWLFDKYSRDDNSKGQQCSESLVEEAHEFNKKISSVFYQILLQQDKEKQEKECDKFISGMRQFVEKGIQTLEESLHEVHVVHVSNKFNPRQSSQLSSEEKRKEIQVSFYKNQNQLTVVDISVFPWIFRFKAGVIERFRRGMIQLNDSELWVQKLNAWYNKVLQIDAVQLALPDIEKLYQLYARYAQGAAKSQVGDAVRGGGHAHDV